MITRLESLRLKNFLSWKHLDWRPNSPLVCLIGENDSGKTNLLRAFDFLKLIIGQPLDQVFNVQHPLSIWLYPGAEELELSLSGEIQLGATRKPFSYCFHIKQESASIRPAFENEKARIGDLFIERVQGDPRKIIGTAMPSSIPVRKSLMYSALHPESISTNNLHKELRLVQLASLLGQIETLRLHPAAIRTPCAPNLPLAPNGANLAAVLEKLSSNPEFRPAFRQLEERLKELIPGISGIGAKSVIGTGGESLRQLSFASQTSGRDFYFGADQASDATLYLLGMLAFSLAPNSVGLTLIEEPELGLHPRMVERLVKLLRDFSQTQPLIMTTHSPLILDCLTPEEIWVVTRDPERCSQIHAMASFSELYKWRDNFNCGEIWLNVPEQVLATSE